MARIFGGISIIIAILGVAGFFRVSEPAFPPVNAQSRDSGRLRLIDGDVNSNMQIYCDPANGNLIYRSLAGAFSNTSVALAIYENGCAKDPRFSQNR